MDVVDQMARKYSVKASSRRWTVQVFYNVLDLAATNAWVLYKEAIDKRISRRKFILQLCKELRQATLQLHHVHWLPELDGLRRLMGTMLTLNHNHPSVVFETARLPHTRVTREGKSVRRVRRWFAVSVR